MSNKIGRLIFWSGLFLVVSVVLANLPESHAYAATAGQGLAKNIADPDGFVYKGWRTTRGIINILLIAALLLISFSSILRINVNVYAVKKALPNLIIGILFANFSFLIIRFLADFCMVITLFIAELGGHPNSFAGFIAEVTSRVVQTTLHATWASAFVSTLLSVVLVPILAIVAVILILWMAMIFYIRLVVLYLLTILAPLAFIAYGIPGMEMYFSQWWKMFVKWLFMLPAMAVILWLALEITRNSDIYNANIAQTLILYVLMAAAASLPFKWGGSITSNWANALKKTGSAAYQGSQTFGGAMGQRSLALKGRAESLRATANSLAATDPRRAEMLAQAQRIKNKSKRWETAGRTVSAPTSLQRGWKARMAENAGARDYFYGQSPLFARAAGGMATYKQMRDQELKSNEGLSESALARKLQNPNLNNQIGGLNEDVRNQIIWGSPAKANGLLRELINQGVLESYELDEHGVEDHSKPFKFSDYVNYMQDTKDFEMARRRMGSRNRGDAYANRVAPFIPPYPPAPPRPMGDVETARSAINNPSLTPEAIERIASLHSAGSSESAITEDVAKHLNIATDSIAPDIKRAFEELEIKAVMDDPMLKSLFTKFSSSSQSHDSLMETSLAAGNLADELAEAMKKGTYGGEIEKAQGHMKELGYDTTNLAMAGRSNDEQATELHQFLQNISKASRSAAGGGNFEDEIKKTIKSGLEFERTGDSIESTMHSEGLTTTSNPDAIRSNQNIENVLKGQVGNIAKNLKVSLNPESLGVLTTSFKNALIMGMTSKKVKSVLGSEAYRTQFEGMIKAHGTAAKTAPSNAETPQPQQPTPAQAPAPEQVQPSSGPEPSASEAPAPEPPAPEPPPTTNT